MHKILVRILRGFLGLVGICLATIVAIGVGLYIGASLICVLFFWIPDFNPPFHLICTGTSIIFALFLCVCYWFGDHEALEDLIKK